MSRKLKTSKSSAFILVDSIDRQYFSEISVEEGYVVITDQKVYFTDERYTHEVSKKLAKSDIKSLAYKDLTEIRDYLLEKNIKIVYINFDKTTVSFYNTLRKFGFKVKDGKDKIQKAIAIKNKDEISSIKKACKITEDTFYFALTKLYDGITELEVKNIIENRYIEQGAEVAFETIVAFGENSAIPHHVSSDRKLSYGDVILIDMGCKVDGYASDLTRTICYKSASEEFVEVYSKVLSANEKALSETRLGMEYSLIDSISRESLKKHKLSEYFTHSLGHGLGLEIHEYPRLSPKGSGKVKNNTVFTIEPGVYFNDKYGIRIEDTVLIRNGKVLRLFTDDKRLLIIK